MISEHDRLQILDWDLIYRLYRRNKFNKVVADLYTKNCKHCWGQLISEWL